MISFFRKSIFGKVLSQVLLVSFVTLSVYPYQVSAFEGPKQPELTSFTLASHDNMVDPFTGDFSYNIPIMHVPGPGGGYPINLAYSGGTPDQEASWVGWGWNINPGVINRQMRGVPDDFDGKQFVQKTHNEKDEHNVMANLGLALSEIFGADLDKSPLNVGANMNIIYNNKRGWDIGFGVDIGIALTEHTLGSGQSKDDDPESQDGDDPKNATNSAAQEEAADSYVNEDNLNAGRAKLNWSAMLDAGKMLKAFGASDPSFGSIHPISDMISVSRITSTGSFQGKGGFALAGVTFDLPYKAAYSHTFIPKVVTKYAAYGYNNTHQAYGKTNALMDYYRDNETLLNRTTKLLAQPVEAYDLFTVSSHDLGGSFRAYRNDIPVYSDPTVSTYASGGGANLEIDQGSGETKLGFGVNSYATQSSTGAWSSGHSALVKVKNASSYLSSEVKKDRVYYRFIDDVAESNRSGNSLVDSYQAHKNVMITKPSALGAYPLLTTMLSGKSGSASFTPGAVLPTKVQPRAKTISQLSLAEVHQLYPSGYHGSRDYQYPPTTSSGDDNDYSNTIAEFRVTREDGHRVFYGIPVYTKSQVNATYSTENMTINSNGSYSKGLAVSDVENTSVNEAGRDGLFSETIVPKYAHSFLITESLSPNYVDIDGQLGPSQGDLGSYVKFEWNNQGYFNNREGLLNQAIAVPGHYSDNDDDKATYLYSQKELYNLKAIETKTHRAVFNYDPNMRLDGLRCCNTGNVFDQSTNKRVKLNSIDLYVLDDKGNPGELIQTVHLKYAYEHWEGTPNSASYIGATVEYPSKSQARLTLKEVSNTYGSDLSGGDIQTKGSKSSYKFHYNSSVHGTLDDRDRWGNYQPTVDNDYSTSNTVMPYTTQDASKADENVAAGLLSRIELPTGGEIRIDYEADDYGYVREKKAQRPFKIVGFSENNTTTPILDNNQNIDARTRIYFELDKDESGADITDITEYIPDLNQIYFRTFSSLKNKPSQANVDPYFVKSLEGKDQVVDYVEGYFKLDKSIGTPYGISTPVNGKRYGWVQIENASLKGDPMNPIKFAAIHHLRYQRPDLANLISGLTFSTSITIKHIGGMIESIVNEALSELSEDVNFYSRAKGRGWGSWVVLDGLPSTLRLNDPDGRKLGGGSRVKALHIDDNWDDMTSSAETGTSYSKYYFYDNADGTSSGVAINEPTEGIADSPFRLPVYSSSTNSFFFKDNSNISFLPVGEGYFPMASVGYSRVTVYDTPGRSSQDFGPGIQEHCFYTAKDFPIRADYTSISREGKTDFSKVMAFLGLNNGWTEGLSQGFSIKLNDMHGKPKHVATYRSNDASLQKPVVKETFVYNTDGLYQPGSANDLQTSVNVQDGELETRSGIKIAEHTDVFVENRASSTFTSGFGLHVNVMVILGFPVFSLFPNPESTTKTTKTIVLSKIFSQKGILEKVITEKDGAVNVAENILYDPVTGQPLYTRSNDQFGSNTYQQTYPARWYYDHTGPAYKNEGLWISDAEAPDYLSPGDLIMDSGGKLLWVDSYDAQNNLQVVNDQNGSAYTLPSGNFKVIRSASRNLLNISLGEVVATRDLHDPTNQLNTANFEMWNRWIDSDYQQEHIEDCITGDQYNENNHPNSDDLIHMAALGEVLGPETPGFGAGQGWPGAAALIPHYGKVVVLIQDPCPAVVVYPDVFRTNSLNVQNYYLYKQSHGKALAVNKEDPNDIHEVVIMEYTPCDWVACLDGVLNATATTLTEDNTNSTDITALSSNVSTQDVQNNPYRYGMKGIPRVNNNFSWVEERKQQGQSPNFQSKAGIDGTYDKFSFFQWPSDQGFHNWIESSKVTRFDVDGNAVESQNSIGIYSSQLLSFCNNLSVANAANARHQEIAFSSFENGLICADNKGHINIGASTDLYAHTGDHSFYFDTQEFPSGITLDADLALAAGKSYMAKMWVREANAGSGVTPKLTSGSTTLNFTKISPWIDGWALYECSFTAGNSLVLKTNNLNYYFDDIRIQPLKSGMQCTVYDPVNFRLVAQLDDNHFATFYTYDEEGNLTGVKVETPDGIQSVQSSYMSSSQIQQ